MARPLQPVIGQGLRAAVLLWAAAKILAGTRNVVEVHCADQQMKFTAASQTIAIRAIGPFRPGKIRRRSAATRSIQCAYG